MKQIKIENNSQEEEVMILDITSMKLISGNLELKEIENNTSYKSCIGGITHVGTKESEPTNDLQFIRMQWTSGAGYVEFKKDIIDYFDSKTEDTFKDTNKLIGEVLNFMKSSMFNSKDRKGMFTQMILRKNLGENKDPEEFKFCPYNHFSANQFQAHIIDINLEEKAVKNFMKCGEVQMDIPPQTSLLLTFF